jgi:DNA-binding MarR family transcriptional regulator
MPRKSERQAEDLRVLKYLARFGERSTSDISEATGVCKSSVYEKLKRLEKSGQVVRRLDKIQNLLWRAVKGGETNGQES